LALVDISRSKGAGMQDTRIIRKEASSADLGTSLSDIWADAQTSRSLFFWSVILKVWRALFRRAAAHGDQTSDNARQRAGA
jgi:hypothetical protein